MPKLRLEFSYYIDEVTDDEVKVNSKSILNM